MLINLRNALMSGAGLPYDAEVEYLESSGTQWIEIGMTFDARCVLDMTFQFTRFVNAATCHGQTSTTGSTPARFAFGKGAASWNDWYCGIGDKNYRTGTALDTAVHRFVVDAPGDKFVIDNTTYNVGWTSFDLPPRPNSAMLYNRARVDSSTLDDSGVYGKLYCCKIWQDGILVRDFIPVRKGTVGYLYDRVSGKLFGNAGTGDFVLGPDVVPVEYIESHGTEYIDTGIVGGSNTVWECDAALTSTSVSNVVGQSYDSGGYKCRFAFGSSATGFWYAGLGNLNNLTNVNSDTSRHLFVLSSPSKKFIIDNAEYPTRWVSWSYPESTIGGIALFGRRLIDNGGVLPYALMRMWGSKIYDNSTPLRSFRPVRVGTDATSWEGAMMDVLTRRIYRNAGTGAFTYGNDLKYPIPSE